MREIKFRGIPLFGEKFVFGSLIVEKDENNKDICIIKRSPASYFEVKTETVGQSTGLKDKNGFEIYEGDIVKWGHIDKFEECWHRVAFVEMFPSLHFRILHYIDGKTLEQKEGDSYCFHYGNFIYKNTHEAMEVIGNIYENPELLENIK